MTRARLLLIFLLDLALCCTPMPAQRRWIVDRGGGPGVDFQDIPPAMAAANDGDSVLVRFVGPYSSFVVTKAIVVEATSGATCPTIEVRGVPRDRHARVDGFVVDGGNRLFEGHVKIADCAGAVHLARTHVLLGQSWDQGLGTVDIARCANVLLTDVRAGTAPSRTGIYKPGVSIADSRVIVQRSTLFGCHGFDSCEGVSPTQGSPALRAQRSIVVIVDSGLRAGDGGNAYQCNHGEYCGGNGGHAVDGDDIVVLGNSSLVGGNAGRSTLVGCTPSPGASASGRIQVTADVTTSGALTRGARRTPSLAWIVSSGTAALGTPTTWTMRGVPGTALWLFLGEHFAITPFPPWILPVVLTPAAVSTGGLGIDATGRVAVRFTVPAIAEWRGRTLFGQALALDPGTLALSLTNVGDLVLR